MEDSQTPFVITISRQTGSGGRKIGQILAQRLNAAYYDQEILSRAAEDTGLGPNVFKPANERKSFLRQVFGAVQPFIGGGDFYANQLSEENVYSLQSGVIKKLANEHSCVIVGRTADHILQDHPRHVSIFITGNTDERIRRVIDNKKVDYKSAVHIIENTDEQRSNYYNFHASKTWGNAENYDICINSSTLGIEETIKFLQNFISAKLKITITEDTTPPMPEVF